MPMTRTVVLVTLATLAAAACGQDTTVPTPTPAPSTTAAVTGIAIGAPSTIAPGASVQLTLTAALSGGSTKDVTALANWSAASPALSLSASGLATGQRPGSATVNATYLTFHAFLSVDVLAPNTYKVSGRILDHGAPLAGANVTASSGTTVVGSAQTDQLGSYTFWGVPGTFTLEVDDYGYTTQTVNETVSASGPLADITLPEAGTAVDLSGSWTLTLAADPTCVATLPTSAQSRTYTLKVTEAGEQITGAATSPTLSGSVDIAGRVIGSNFSFDYGESYYQTESPDMLGGGPWVSIIGIVTGTATGSSFVVPFSGQVLYYTAPYAFDQIPPPQVDCSGPNGTASFQRGSSTAAKRIRR